MAYYPKTWENGEVITAEALNHLEQGVAGYQVGPQGPTGPMGPPGPQGAQGEPGTSLVVNGRYDTLEDLKAAHPIGSPGEAYAVGTVEDNTTYVWSVDLDDWDNIGPLRGAQGPQGIQGAGGYPGEPGPMGPQGEPGPVGPQGPQGEPGAVGPQGSIGQPGVTYDQMQQLIQEAVLDTWGLSY